MSDIAKAAGISRQALYLHFRTRAELLIAATLHLDKVQRGPERLIPSRKAKTGLHRLQAFVDGWADYIPDIYGVAKALLAMADTDEAAALAWGQRMQDMREGCQSAVLALQRDGQLVVDLSAEQATDLLWTLLSVRNWEQLVQTCGWSQEDYKHHMQGLAKRMLVVCDRVIGIQ